jgi:hypothetical protein
MTDLHALVATMTPEQQAFAYQVLDACSRPVRAREIEAVLRSHGVSRSRAVKPAGTLKGFHVIALLGPEDYGEPDWPYSTANWQRCTRRP